MTHVFDWIVYYGCAAFLALPSSVLVVGAGVLGFTLVLFGFWLAAR